MTITVQTLEHLDRRGAMIRAVEWAKTDFLADGGNLEDVATLTMMAQEIVRYVQTMQRLVRLLTDATEGHPRDSHTVLRDVIAGEIVADHYNLTPSAARVLTAAAEAT